MRHLVDEVPMSVEEFLNDIQDANEAGRVASLFEFASFVLQNAVNGYRSADGLPLIKVRRDPIQQAAGMPGYILISTGLIQFCLQTHFPRLRRFDFITSPLSGLPRSIYQRCFFAWTLAHEYFHGLRLHNAASKNLGAGVDDKAFEFDADLLATAAIYRSLQVYYGNNVQDLALRLAVFNAVFWSMLTLKIESPQATHPPIPQRLLDISLKLIYIPETLDQDPDFSLSREETRFRCGSMWKFIFYCSARFGSIHGPSTVGANLYQEWKALQRDGKLELAADAWQLAKSEVERLWGFSLRN